MPAARPKGKGAFHDGREEWAKLPCDLSYNHDHYLYGQPQSSIKG